MWLYQGKEFSEPIDKLVGFVYIIHCLANGRKYIGKKSFWSTKRKQVKGKSKRIKVESDWRTYWSSSDELKADVLKLGEDAFQREIIHLCVGKGELSYLEAREQFDRRVLEQPSAWYNSWIMVRVNGSHLKTLRK
jgi:hypothetical protein